MSNKYDEGYYRVAASWFLALDDGRKSNSYWAKVFGVDPETIENWRREGGKRNRYRVSPELLARAEELINAGHSYKRVARELGGVSDVALGKRFPKPRRRTQRDNVTWAKELLEDGCSYAEVERSTGIGVKELQETYPGHAWSIDDLLDFQRTLRNAKKKMPTHIKEIFFGP